MYDLKKLRGIVAADRDTLRAQISAAPSPSCERNFANLFMWRGPYNTQIASNENSSLVYYGATGILNFPIGKEPEPEELFETALAAAKSGRGCGIFYDVPPEYAAKNADALLKYFILDENAGEFDYIYETEKLLSLSGAALKKKRNLIRQFEKNFPGWSAEKLAVQNAEEAFGFLLKQNGKKENLAETAGLKDEDKAIAEAAQNFEFLGLQGVLLYPEKGLLAGAAIFSPINPQIFTIHFEKCDASFKGAPQKLVWLEAAALKNMGAEFMNREQDLGAENLRKAKSSLDPCAMYKRKLLKLKGEFLAQNSAGV